MRFKDYLHKQKSLMSLYGHHVHTSTDFSMD
jgi:hypothetical protein